MHRNRILTLATALLFPVAALACGGGEQAGSQEQAGGEQAAQQETAGEQAGMEQQGELTMPDWISVDEENQTATLEIIAAKTSDNMNGWNFNGYYGGNATIVVPEGYEITIDFQNNDQVNPHSLGIDEQVGGYPANFSEVTPAFEGAVTEGANEMGTSTQPGQSETITFTAGEAGEYAMVCYVPAHANQGMWIHFHVSAEGEAGFRTSQGS